MSWEVHSLVVMQGTKSTATICSISKSDDEERKYEGLDSISLAVNASETRYMRKPI